MFKALRHAMFALVLVVCAPFAYAIDVCKQAACRYAKEYESFDKAVAKFHAELAANFGWRTSEADRANGLLKESNGYRIALMSQACNLPFEVGWGNLTHKAV